MNIFKKQHSSTISRTDFRYKSCVGNLSYNRIDGNFLSKIKNVYIILFRYDKITIEIFNSQNSSYENYI